MSTSPKGKSGWAIIFVAFFFIFPLEATAGKEPVIRVLIGTQYKANFRGDGVNSIFVKGISSKERKIKSLNLIYSNGDIKYSINNTKNQWIDLPKNFNLRIRNNDKRGIWVGDRRYAGELRISFQNERIQVINYLKLEKYLKSVVGSEMPKEFPLAALQAQAVAARTYALKTLGKNKLFDVESTQSSQVYLGLEAETPKINRAVRSTRSLALFYENKLIDAVFHSSSGGRTEDSGQVWKHQFPYLRSVVDYDQNGKKYRWSTTFNSKELKNIFSDLGGLTSIQVIKKSNSNRVLKVIVYGPYGNKIVSGKDLRKKLQLLSTKFEVDLKFDQLNEENKLNNSLYNNQSNLIFDQEIEEYLPPQGLPEIPKNYFLLFDGFGAGHGVGMSQWGAKEMADSGKGFRGILKHYYTGVSIKSF